MSQLTFSRTKVVAFFWAVCLLAPVGAGVVEDAEEELRKLREQNGTASVSVGADRPTVPVATMPSGVSRPSTPATAGARTTPPAQDQAGASSTGRPAASPDLEEEPVRERFRPTAADKKGYLASFLTILVLAFLIAAAASLGGRIADKE